MGHNYENSAACALNKAQADEHLAKGIMTTNSNKTMSF